MSEFLKDFFSFFSEENKIISRETFEELELKVELAYSWELVERLINSLTYLPKRDNYEIVFDIEGNTKRLTSNTNIDAILEFFKDNPGSSLLTHLTIYKKSINCISSIYFIELFERYIKEVGLYKFLIAFNSFFNEKHVFEVFQEITEIRTKSIVFQQPSSSSNFDGFYCDRKGVLSNINDNSCFVQGAEKLVAMDFFLEERSKTRKFLNEVFDKLAIILSISSLSDVFELYDDGTITFKISGYKTIYADKVCVSNYIPILPYLYKITSWVYENDKCSDKLGIARNVISLYSKEQEGLLGISDKTWLAIKSNYSIYLKDNVQKYLEVKNKVTDYIFSHEVKIHSITEQLLSSFKSNFLGVLGFIVSVVIVNGLRQNGIGVIFSKEYLYIVFSLTTLSLAWLAFSWIDARAKMNNSRKIIESTLNRNYANIIAEDEINSYLLPAFKDSDDFFNIQLKKYRNWWISILLLFAFIFVFGNLFFVVKGTETPSATTPLIMPNKLTDQVRDIESAILPFVSSSEIDRPADLSNPKAPSVHEEQAVTKVDK